ncbi:MAG: NUDIX domain-containing protein [Eubacteriales bacterium]|nr:NUDIX domain-containing protein [Eubacteriales bacterium]
MEYLDVCDEFGMPTGAVVERGRAHREGIRHRTAHVWILRRQEGRTEILLQKRSQSKDSFPGLYDTSSAGHVPAGDEPLASALRELEEELGLHAEAEDLRFIGTIENIYERRFRGALFRDNEFCRVYVYTRPVEMSALRLQADEVERVDWFELEAVRREIEHSRERFCVPREGLELLRRFLESEE